MRQVDKSIKLSRMQDNTLTFATKIVEGDPNSGETIMVPHQGQITVQLDKDEINPENINRIRELALEVLRYRVIWTFRAKADILANECRHDLENLLSDDPEEIMRNMGCDVKVDNNKGTEVVVKALEELEQLGVVKVNDSDDSSLAIDIKDIKKHLTSCPE